MNAPSDVLTFLFTDIEGSTRRWDADANAMRAALETHNRLLRDTVEAHGGQVFNYTGDGMCAVFTSPRPAVDAAIAAQQALELPVRIGIATGEAELRGNDYFGTVLNRTARVMAAGHGGQILLDGATAGLLGGVALIALGPRRLRDISNLVDLYQVVASGLKSDFPPLKTLDATPGNLKPQTTSFVGREAEVADLEAAIKTHRVVTLTGVGGVGKTRLALEVASRVAADFSDGVWVIELAPVGDPAAVPEAVAATLGITQQPGLSLSDSIAGALEGRSRLLVFDNCEHVLDAAADLIDAVFAHSSTVKALVTSREGLRVNDEQLWPVPSLDVDAGVDSAAATLFVDRAQAVSAAVTLTKPDEAAATVEICQRLDGIPLAIELAASRMLSMSVTDLRDRLDDRFRLLVGSRRGLERHQTLRHAVQWSFDLLDDDETSLLTMCSVFAGGFDLASARAVTGSEDDITTLDLLDSLVRKSLLVADRSSGPTRYNMLETIRQFAEEQLVLGDEAESTRAAHARYFAMRESDVMDLWDGPRQREAYEWLTRELPNLRAAFRWAADRTDLDIAVAIAFYASVLGLCSERYEPITWAEELIVPARAARHRRLAQLYVMASQCYASGRVEQALQYIEAGLDVIDHQGYDEVPFDIEAAFSGAYTMVGRADKAAELLRKTIARTQGAHVLSRATLTLALSNAGAYDEALASAECLPAAADATDNPNAKALALLAYGWAYGDADHAAAYDIQRRALKISQDSGNRFVESTLAIGLSRLTVVHGDPVEALDYLDLAVRNYRHSGSFNLMHGPLVMLATFLGRLGRREPAATIMGYAAIPIALLAFPETEDAIDHLREVLGEEAYGSFARVGESMTPAAAAAYALDQIDLARVELL